MEYVVWNWLYTKHLCGSRCRYSSWRGDCVRFIRRKLEIAWIRHRHCENGNEITRIHGYNSVVEMFESEKSRINWIQFFSDYIRPICLPFSEQFRRQSFENQNFTAVGWGSTETSNSSAIYSHFSPSIIILAFSAGTRSELKLKVLVPFVSNDICASQYIKARAVINSAQICAGGIPGRDSCRGE